MTDTPTPIPPLGGQDLAVAARATRVLLDDILEEVGTSFLAWAALRGATTDPRGAVDREQLVTQYAEALATDDDAPIRAAFDELEAGGLLRRLDRDPAGDDATPAAPGAVIVAATPAGAELARRIQERIGRLAADLYGGLPTDDLVTTQRVLSEVTERARALRRRPSPTPSR